MSRNIAFVSSILNPIDQSMRFTLLLLLLLVTTSVSAQTSMTWSQPIAVANGAIFDNVRPRITLVDGGNRALVTWGRNIGGRKAYSARFGTSTFDTPLLINNGSNVNTSTFESSEISSKGDTAYVAFTTYPISTIKVRVQSSFDGGQSWSDPVYVDSLGADIPTFANVTVSPDGNPTVMYMRQQSNWGNPRYVMRKSLDAGQTFLPEVPVSAMAPGGEVCDCCAADLTYDGEDIMAIFRNNDNNLRDHWVTISSDSGQTFSTAIDLDTLDWMIGVCPSSAPSVHISGDSIYGVFYSQGGSSGLPKVYLAVASKTTGQLAWNRELHPNAPSQVSQNFPMIAGNEDTLGVVWTTNDNGNTDVYFTYSVNGSAEMWDKPRFNVVDLATGTQTDPDIAYANGVFHITWADDATGNVMYRTATIGPPVGTDDPQPSSLSISVWPQPASEEARVEITGAVSDELEVEWSGLDGRVIRREMMKPGVNTIDRNGLSDGIYLLRVQDGNTGRSLVKRISLME